MYSPEASFTVNLRKEILYRHRVTQLPDVNPRDDNTIKAVLEQKGVWVEKMMSAVLNLEGINDGANSKKTPSFKEGHKNFFEN
ncbi:hypothetical protein SLS60_008464 [Paraconiothyrium brasiliense]|uniref:Uncharacterized protein n=1 Tax=Paraconiothyrium brasiliense TaxID=300254 RepID=A0ABR3R0N3_9PLEO